jgi:biopolymer transport protein ExbD
MRFSHHPVTELGSRRIYFVLFFHVCLLLVAFAVFLPRVLRPAGLSIILPHSLTSEPVADDGLVISLTEAGEIYVNGRPYSFKALRAVLADYAAKDASVLIKADRRVQVGSLAQIWDLCRAVGLGRVSIATNV